ncbi:NAD(P)-dependent dehydrogenase (short-subunit alcohol dehydrogenase family) [Streptomyces sp. LBL]|uniref:SDR family NAD(P)-dependent oxidoreductase n=1 Tax=Streptomyces sp. LBL TaxID=2940562 RepID=UPI002473B70B|nr:SDR family oxidoreductase [Streptomyces sp. LBL]MDH6624474.1 NAD(P)-dependent dehydrogenase (short-subunit alcohol dehydrogenase family) [Streptomyces sp. LBL]
MEANAPTTPVAPVIVVSGATGGMGAAVVEELARSDATVALLGRDAGRLERTRQAIEARTGGAGRLVTYETDINDSRSVDATVAELVAGLGRIDGLVHAAGDGPLAPLNETTDDMWQATFNGKLMGAVRLTRAVQGPMTEAGGGSIVLVSGVFRKDPDPLFPVNSAVNAALATFGKAVSKDLGRSGIRVNVVDPGAVRTPLWDEIAKTLGDRTGATADQVTTQVAAQTPLGTLAEPSDVAQLVAFLLSPAARHLAGASITLDGGASAGL